MVNLLSLKSWKAWEKFSSLFLKDVFNNTVDIAKLPVLYGDNGWYSPLVTWYCSDELSAYVLLAVKSILKSGKRSILAVRFKTLLDTWVKLWLNSGYEVR